jgi:2-polyprenyl-3-methyl-5-hydroxy-6-metoxy-1,4-benzoquinol methylase
MMGLRGHLEYYLQHGISPVRYDFSSVEAHLQRRGSLYRSLGLTPLALRGARVLEVAAGSGQNSLYMAAQMPRSLTLLEPNPAGRRDIEQLYADQPIPHTRPAVVAAKLEDYAPAEPFDVVVCENWLGHSTYERALLRRLCGFVAAGGVLALTSVSPVGLLPNILRRAIAARLCRNEVSFERRTAMLVEVFKPHLATLPAMTRSAVDWVQDNMLNPAYFELCLPAPTVFEEVGASFTVLGSNPVLAQDWRWFKALHGEARRFNAHFLDEYFAQCHGLMDHRCFPDRGDATRNRRLEAECFAVIGAVRDLEAALAAGGDEAAPLAALAARLRQVSALAGEAVDGETLQALEEGVRLATGPALEVAAVAKASAFAGLFGRETLYLSFQREGAGA